MTSLRSASALYRSILKKRGSRIAIACVVALIAACGSFTVYRSYAEYETFKRQDNSYQQFEAELISEKEEQQIRERIDEWDLQYGGVVEEQWLMQMRSVGLSADVGGLIKLWTGAMPEFSIFNPSKNALWVERAKLREVMCPMGLRGHYREGFLSASNDELAIIHEMQNGDFRFAVYMPPNDDIEQGEVK